MMQKRKNAEDAKLDIKWVRVLNVYCVIQKVKFQINQIYSV